LQRQKRKLAEDRKKALREELARRRAGGVPRPPPPLPTVEQAKRGISAPIPKPIPTPPKLLVKIPKIISPQIQATRERAIRFKAIRDLARKRGVNISTRARELGFIRKIEREEREIIKKEKEVILEKEKKEKVISKVTIEPEVKKIVFGEKIKKIISFLNSAEKIRIQKIKDLTSLGLTREAREWEKVSQRIGNYNEQIKNFEKRFGGGELNPEEFSLAKQEEARLDRELKDIEKQEQSIKKAIPTFVSEKVGETAESLRQEKLKLVRELGWKALFDPRVKKIDARLQSFGISETIISAGIGVLMLPETIKNIITEPSNLLRIPSALKKEVKDFGRIAMISPSEAIAKIGAEIYLLHGTGKAFKVVGKLASKTAARISGKLTKIKGGKILIEPAKEGTGVTIKTISVREIIKAKPKVKIAITKPKPKPKVELEFIKPGLKKILEPTKAQTKLIGKKIKLVTSAQSNKIVGLIRRKRVIRKPIAGERILSRRLKQLLKRFDKRKITPSEFKELNKRLLKETRGSSDILERSFFVDPKGRVRISRLGIQKEASLGDIIRGNFSFRTQNPQIIFFKDIKVQAFPKTEIFKKIKSKLKLNKSLTAKEYQELLKFQIKKSGKFKPIGHLTKEPELTLAPGEIIKKVKTIAKIEINGVIVPVVKAKVVQASKSTSKLLKKARTGEINAKEIKKLRNNLKKETGFKKPQLTRRTKPKPRISIKRKALVGVTRLRKKPRPRFKPRKIPRPKPRLIPKKRIIPRKIPRPKPTPSVRPSPRPIPRPKPRPIPKPRPTPRPLPRPMPLVALKKRKPKRKPKKKQQAYNVYVRPLKKKGQKRPKLMKVNVVSLTKRKAKDLRSYTIDTSLARSGRIRATKGKPNKPSLKIPKNYAQRTKYKFRDYRIIKGKKRPLVKQTIIERRKRLLDTPQEKRQITLKRRIAQLRKPIKRKLKKKKKFKKIGGIF